MVRPIVLGLALTLLAPRWASAAPAPPPAPPLPSSPYQLTSIGELVQVVTQARQEVIYLTAGIPSQGLADALTALAVPIYVLLPSRPLTPPERSLLRSPYVQVRRSDRFSGAGGFLLIDRKTIVLGPLLTTEAMPAGTRTLVAWMPDADQFVYLFRTIWDTASPAR